MQRRLPLSVEWWGVMIDRFVPFPERARYGMLKAALDEGISAKTLAKRSGYSLDRVRRLVMDEAKEIHADELAIWHFSVNGSLIKFSLEAA